MESEIAEGKVGGQAADSGPVSWTSSMSAYMLTHLANVVANGTRTSSGFKKVHLNACAKAINDHFKQGLTRDQISNHLRMWKRKYAKICRLKDNLSAELWDDDNCTITLDHEHYTNHIKDHKQDAEFLNKPIEHYREMACIFGNSLAMGKYAKGSNEPLATKVHIIDDKNDGVDEDATHSVNVGESSASKPKRAKIAASEDDGLQATLVLVGEKIASAIEKAGSADNELPDGLWETVKNLPGFEEAQLAHYYAHLVENVRSAKAFNSLDFSNKIIWAARFVSTNFSG